MKLLTKTVKKNTVLAYNHHVKVQRESNTGLWFRLNMEQISGHEWCSEYATTLITSPKTLSPWRYGIIRCIKMHIILEDSNTLFTTDTLLRQLKECTFAPSCLSSALITLPALISSPAWVSIQNYSFPVLHLQNCCICEVIFNHEFHFSSSASSSAVSQNAAPHTASHTHPIFYKNDFNSNSCPRLTPLTLPHMVQCSRSCAMVIESAWVLSIWAIIRLYRKMRYAFFYLTYTLCKD